MLTEKQLVEKSQAGDIQAFEELVRQYQNKIYALAYRYMGNQEDAYDISQEVFLKAYRSLHSFDGASGFGTWLYRVATNVCLDELRRRKNKIVPLSLDEAVATRDGDEEEREIADKAPPPDILYEKEEFSLYIQKLLEEMKPDQKNVIILRDIMDLSYEEITEVLNCSMGTVKSRLSRARNILKEKLLGRELLP
jgi:RNA polymerase sigma-70 factor (ECF subfamily)